jgi:diguanylate cyclase (GGDEF)-like protein
VFAFVEMFFSSDQFKHSQILSLVFFGILTAAGAIGDILLKNSSLLWPCFTAAMLYFYFFIVQSDSKIDSLTGLGNRLSFNEFIKKLSRSNSETSHSIIMMDMDHFKEINDTLGHLEGDNALRDMSVIIKNCIRETDFAARYGGDEFILAVKSEYNVEKLIERIRQAMDIQNEKNRRPYKLQMSYGWDVFNLGSRTIEDFLIHIDKRMYENKTAKVSGGNKDA